MALEIMIVRHSAAGCRSRLGAPSPQRSSGLHGGQASSQIIHGEKEVRTSGALGGIAAASTARLETQHPLGSGGPTRRKPLAALLQTARLLLTASLRRKVQFAPAFGARWSGETRPKLQRSGGPFAPSRGAVGRSRARPRTLTGVEGALCPRCPPACAGPEHPRHFSYPRPPAAAPVLLRRTRPDARPGRAVCAARRSAMAEVVRPRTHILGVYQRHPFVDRRGSDVPRGSRRQSCWSQVRRSARLSRGVRLELRSAEPAQGCTARLEQKPALVSGARRLAGVASGRSRARVDVRPEGRGVARRSI